MVKRLLQAVTITLLLNLLAHMSPPNTTQPGAVAPAPKSHNLIASWRQ
ncbi:MULTISPECIES: hypothetical protein [unclassified Coleofasciculus]|nr:MULTISPECIES: hypothetical protein [unclassified Coleofasciculus]MBE9126545.1 hypothetical protein [Coleofasciculus sp. LEGE 07081]MBE9149979.1 hypothetical protein [Coleofasciculus sp. LEGE 07092]